MSVVEGFKESVTGSMSSSPCSIWESVSIIFDQNGAGGEGGDYSKLGRLGRKDRRTVFRGNFYCDESGECAGVE